MRVGCQCHDGDYLFCLIGCLLYEITLPKESDTKYGFLGRTLAN